MAMGMDYGRPMKLFFIEIQSFWRSTLQKNIPLGLIHIKSAVFLCVLGTVRTRKICFNLPKCVKMSNHMLLGFKNYKLRDLSIMKFFITT